MASPVRRVRPRSTLLARTWWIAVVLAVAAGAFAFYRLRPASAPTLTGYLSGSEILAAEYQRYVGAALQSPALENKFKNAEALIAKHNYAAAATLLESVAEQAPVPAVYNNLGVLYAEMHDRARALNAFRDGLSRDASYSPIRHNMDRLKQLSIDSGDPVTEEIEPNNSIAMANPIAPAKPVDASIDSNGADEDTFVVISPAPPRDVLALKIETASKELVPAVRIYDADRQMIDQSRNELEPGAPLTKYISPQPNSTLYVQVSGARGTAGKYVLTVQPLKAFDEFEPNDGIFEAHRIACATSLEANIMDSEDTDYYQFTALKTGTLEIDIQNRSSTLIPALTTFSPDRRNTGFGPDLRTPGSGLTHHIEVQQNQTYFIQVWSQGNSSGAYTLKVE